MPTVRAADGCDFAATRRMRSAVRRIRTAIARTMPNTMMTPFDRAGGAVEAAEAEHALERRRPACPGRRR